MNKRGFVPKENKLKTSRKPIDEASLLKALQTNEGLNVTNSSLSPPLMTPSQDACNV